MLVWSRACKQSRGGTTCSGSGQGIKEQAGCITVGSWSSGVSPGTPCDFPVLACCWKDCMGDVAQWMGDSKLKMTDDRTELMAISTRFKLSQVIPNLAPMSISGCDIPFSQSVGNLGLYLDETLSMDTHIKYLCRILFCQNWKNPLLPVN